MNTHQTSASHTQGWQIGLTPSIEKFKHFVFSNPHKRAIWQLATLGVEDMRDSDFVSHAKLRILLFRVINKQNFDVDNAPWSTPKREWDRQLEMLKRNLEKMSGEQAKVHMFAIRNGVYFH